MKLVIQIPCYNEENSLPITVSDLPNNIEGIDEISIVVVDDGSIDKTVDVAKALGVESVVEMSHNCGLAKAFVAGLNESLRIGADIIVNTDADNQYNAQDIVKLIEPILKGDADIVIGSRPVDNIKHFSPLKKFLQKVGSKVMRIISSTDVEDAPSGFRAFSRNAALQINVFDNYTYTLETNFDLSTDNVGTFYGIVPETDSSSNPTGGYVISTSWEAKQWRLMTVFWPRVGEFEFERYITDADLGVSE